MNGKKPAFPGVVNIQDNLSISNLELDSLKFGLKKWHYGIQECQ